MDNVELYQKAQEDIMIDKKSKTRLSLSNIACRLTHKIEVIEEVYFVDTVALKKVGLFYCTKCEKRFMANSKSSWFRVEL